MKFATPGLQFGLDRPLVVREVIIKRDPVPCRLAYVSDIHLRRGRSRMLSAQVIDALERANPDLILLGGDLVDHASELEHLKFLLDKIMAIAPVFAIPGNHDRSVGEVMVRDAVTRSGASWIEGVTASFTQHSRRFSISGPGAHPSPDADFTILCAHNPSIWKHAKYAGFNLVLAGHLHGCQGVLFKAGGRLFPGALFYPYNFIRQKHGHSHLVVSMGCSDLIPVRWACPREILLCIL